MVCGLCGSIDLKATDSHDKVFKIKNTVGSHYIWSCTTNIELTAKYNGRLRATVELALRDRSILQSITYNYESTCLSSRVHLISTCSN